MDLWRIWAKALGEKASSDSQEADKVALIRTLIVGVNFITCFFIMASTMRHWGRVVADFQRPARAALSASQVIARGEINWDWRSCKPGSRC